MKIDFRKCWNPKSLFTKTEKPVPRPAGREQVIDWFKTTQRPKKIGFNSEGNAHEWFHGLITRSQAEELLDEKEVHSFLIRLSDKVWGYTISYRCEERIKHFLIDACHFKKVKFDGNSEKLHKDLHALISFHETNPISPAGEVLKFPVGQANEDDPDYSELLSDED